MRIHLNPDRCDGHGECTLAAPEVFELPDGENVSRLRMLEVGEDRRPQVTDAVNACPVQAISIQE
jgi:ferredoxin